MGWTAVIAILIALARVQLAIPILLLSAVPAAFIRVNRLQDPARPVSRRRRIAILFFAYFPLYVFMIGPFCFCDSLQNAQIGRNNEVFYRSIGYLWLPASYLVSRNAQTEEFAIDYIANWRGMGLRARSMIVSPSDDSDYNPYLR